MVEILQRAVQASLFRRHPYERARWESTATADAALLVILVAGTVAIISAVLGPFGVTGTVSRLLNMVIRALAGWLFLGVATWFAGSRLFTPADDGRRRFEHVQTILRMHGLAYLPMILGVVGGAAGLIGFVWYLAGSSLGTAIAFDAKVFQGAISVLLGAAVLFIIELIVGVPFALLGGIF